MVWFWLLRGHVHWAEQEFETGLLTLWTGWHSGPLGQGGTRVSLQSHHGTEEPSRWAVHQNQSVSAVCFQQVVKIKFQAGFFLPALFYLLGYPLFLLICLQSIRHSFCGAGGGGKYQPLGSLQATLFTVSMNHSKWMIIIIKSESSMNHC